MRPTRKPWFGCACCPPNIARLIASLGQYAYSTKGDELAIHLYAQGTVTALLGGKRVTVSVLTRYPWDGAVDLRVAIAPSGRKGERGENKAAGRLPGARGQESALFTLALRIPGWCQRASMRVLADEVDLAMNVRRGYARVKRLWTSGDTVRLRFDMPVVMMRAHPRVSAASGRVALQRGPVVYCVEEIDNGKDLDALMLPPDTAFHARFDKGLLGGVTVLTASARRLNVGQWKDALYAPTGQDTKSARVPVRAVPYFAWANRRPGEMLVWLRSSEKTAP
jgi:hypothetical protein